MPESQIQDVLFVHAYILVQVLPVPCLENWRALGQRFGPVSLYWFVVVRFKSGRLLCLRLGVNQHGSLAPREREIAQSMHCEK